MSRPFYILKQKGWRPTQWWNASFLLRACNFMFSVLPDLGQNAGANRPFLTKSNNCAIIFNRTIVLHFPTFHNDSPVDHNATYCVKLSKKR